MKKILLLILLAFAPGAFAQNTGSGPVTKATSGANKNDISEDLNVGSGRTHEFKSGSTLKFDAGATVNGAATLLAALNSNYGATALTTVTAAGNTNLALLAGDSRRIYTLSVGAGSAGYLATLTLQNTNAVASQEITIVVAMPASTNPRLEIHNLTSGGTQLGYLVGRTIARNWIVRARFDGTNWSLLGIHPADMRAATENFVHRTTGWIFSDVTRRRMSIGHRPNILLYGDSLVNGSGYGAVGDYFTPGWAAAVGVGGRGYYGFGGNGVGTNINGEVLIGTTSTNATSNWNPGVNGWTQWTTLQTTGDGSYSFNGYGMYQTSASNLSLYIKTPRAGFTRATLFYLVKSGGGSFTFGNTVTGITTAVSCSGSTTAMKSVTLEAWSGSLDDNQVAITSINGAVSFFGIFFENPSNSGIVSISGHGGNMAYEFAQLNGTAFTNYVAALKPAIVSVCLGANDSGTRSASQFAADLTTIVQRIQAADPDVAVVLQVPTILNNMGLYAGAYADVAAATGASLYFWSSVLGEAPNYLGPDNTHPSMLGCQLLAADMLRYFGATDGPSSSMLWPYQSLDYTPSLVVAPDNDSTFTAGTTNWTASNGGSATLNAGSLTVQSSGAGSGALLASANFGGNLTPGVLYMLSYNLVSAPATGVVTFYAYDGSTNLLPRMWPSGLATPDVGATGYQSMLFRPTTAITTLRLWLQNASQSATVTNITLKPVLEQGRFIGGKAQAESYFLRNGQLNATTKTQAAGTNYVLTATSAAVTMGTTSPALTVPATGKYTITGAVHLYYNGATFAANRTVTLKVRRTNNTAADVSGAITAPVTGVVSTATGTWLVAQLPPTDYTTNNTNDTLALYADVSVVPTAGSLEVAPSGTFIAIKRDY